MKQHEVKEILLTLQRIAAAMERIARALEQGAMDDEKTVPIP